MFSTNCVSLLFMLSVQITFLNGMDSGFTFLLAARKRECFFETLKVNMSLDLEYQVIEGGELDINFELLDPNGKQLIYDDKESDESHEVTITTPGVYRFCIDNSFSTLTNKLVYLDLGIIREEDQSSDVLDTFFNVYANLDGIRVKLDKVSSHQGALRAKEARQRYFLEGNNSRVVWVSSVASVIMIAAGLVQVYFVRHLFDDRRKTRI